jgi:glutaminyl-peptide cyclotransferase
MTAYIFGSLSRAIKSKTPLLLILIALSGCNKDTPRSGNGATPRYGYDIVNTWPHDTQAYTQGLIYQNGQFIESTGQVGHSSLRLVQPETGNILKKVLVPEPYFAEGAALLNGKVYQLTWEHQLGFIYDAATLQKTGEFKYQGEGWGLTTDGTSLILSDGSNRLRFLDPNSFIVKKTVAVKDGERVINELNELEFVNGEVFANVWHSDAIARINPENGKVVGWLDMRGLLKKEEVSDPEAVLNGIAFDSASNRLFVTGKLWPKVFEIRIKDAASGS